MQRPKRKWQTHVEMEKMSSKLVETWDSASQWSNISEQKLLGGSSSLYPS